MLIKLNMPAILVHTVALPGIEWTYLLWVVLAGGGELVGALLALVLADRTGRRATLVALCAVNVVFCAAALIATTEDRSRRTPWGLATMLTALGGVAATHAAGPQTTALAYAAEVQPTAHRSAVFGAAIAVNQLLQAVIELAPVCRRTGTAVKILIATNAACAVATWLLLPETARLDAAGIDRAFDAHWLWGRFSRGPDGGSGGADGGGGGGQRSSSPRRSSLPRRRSREAAAARRGDGGDIGSSSSSVGVGGSSSAALAAAWPSLGSHDWAAPPDVTRSSNVARRL